VSIDTPICWAIEINDGPLIPCDNEDDAIANWLTGEYELGLLITVHRGYPCGHCGGYHPSQVCHLIDDDNMNVTDARSAV
jgi:hypothetical protein